MSSHRGPREEHKGYTGLAVTKLVGKGKAVVDDVVEVGC